MSQKRSKKRRNANQDLVSTAQVQIGNAVENLLNGLESIRETFVRAGRGFASDASAQAYEHDDELPTSAAAIADNKRLEKYSQELSSLVDDATRLKELCELCMKIEDTTQQGTHSAAAKELESLPQRSVHRSVPSVLSSSTAPSSVTTCAAEVSTATQICEKVQSTSPSKVLTTNSGVCTNSGKAHSGAAATSAVLQTISASGKVSGNANGSSVSGSGNVAFFNRMLLDFYTSIRKGRVPIRADESVCVNPIPRDVREIVSRILAEHDVGVLLPLFEKVLSEHVRNIRDSLVSIMRELEALRCSGKSGGASDSLLLAPTSVSQSHAYCFVKLYVDEYRALAAGARSVAQVLSDAYVDDSQLEKVFYLNWESMNKHVFYSVVYNDELIHDYVATCVRKLQASRAHEQFNANRELLAAIALCDPVALCDVATKTHSACDEASQPTSSCELLVKCTAAELLARHERVQSELETARIKRFLLDALQQTQSAKVAAAAKPCVAAPSVQCASSVDPVLDRIQTLRDTFELNRRLFVEDKGLPVAPTAADGGKKRRKKKKKLPEASAQSSASPPSDSSCCAKCGSSHRISADAERIDRLLAERERQLAESGARVANGCDNHPQRAVQNVTELLAKQSQLAQFIESIQNGKVHLCEHLQEEFEAKYGQLPAKSCQCHRAHASPCAKSSDSAELARRLASLSVPPVPPFRNDEDADGDGDDDGESNSQSDDESGFLAAAMAADRLERPGDAAACVLTGPWAAGDGPYYLLDTGSVVPPGQTAEQLDDFCKAIFTPMWYAPANIVLPSQGAESDKPLGSVAGYPVVINGHLYMLVNGAECCPAPVDDPHAPQTPPSAVNVVPVRLPDDIVHLLHSSLSSFSYDDSVNANNASSSRSSNEPERPISMNVQRGVVFIDEPSLQLPTTDNSIDFHTKPMGGTGRITVPSASTSLSQGAECKPPASNIRWMKPTSRTAVHFSDDEDEVPADDEPLDAEDDATASAGSDDDVDDDDYDGDGDEDAPLDGHLPSSAPAGPTGPSPKCNCQHCAFFGHPVNASAQRDPRALHFQERLRKKLAKKQRALPEHDQPSPSEVRHPLPDDPSLEAIDAAERMTTKLFADFKKAVHDVVERTVKRQSERQETELDELVRFIEGGFSAAVAQPPPSTTTGKSEKRKRKKDKKNKTDPVTPSANSDNTNVKSQQHNVQSSPEKTVKAQEQPKPSEAKSKETVKEKSSAKKDEKRKTNNETTTQKAAERDSKTQTTKSERERKANVQQSKPPVATESAREELVIPDFGEVPISLDSRNSRNQHKNGARPDGGKDKGKRQDKNTRPNVAPSSNAASASTRNGPKSETEADNKADSGAKNAPNASRPQHSSVSPGLSDSAASKVTAPPSPVAGNDSRERKVNPRYRNGIKLEAFVPKPLRSAEKVAGCTPSTLVSVDSRSQKQTQTLKNNVSESNACTGPTVAPHQPVRSRTYQNTNFSAPQTLPQTQIVNSQAAATRHRPRNFYGPQYPSGAHQSEPSSVYDHCSNYQVDNAAYASSTWDTREQAAAYAFSTTHDSANIPMWEPRMPAAPQTAPQSCLSWTADDDRTVANAESALAANAFAQPFVFDGALSAPTPTWTPVPTNSSEPSELAQMLGGNRPADDFANLCSGFSPVTPRTSDELLHTEQLPSDPPCFAPLSNLGMQITPTDYSSVSSVWQLPSFAPNESSAAMRTGGSFELLPSASLDLRGNLAFNASSLPYDLNPLTSPIMADDDELPIDGDDDFDPEVEQFKKICMNDECGNTRQRIQVQVNLSEIFKKKF